MNLKRATSVLVLVVGIGLFNIKLADAKNALTKANTAADSIHINPSSSFTIAQLTEAIYPLYGSWKLTFSVNGTVYKGYLIMKGYYGNLRVSYFDPHLRKKQVIDESILLMSSSEGLVLLGYDPVYQGTSIRHPNYSADSFIFSVEPDGSLIAFTCDNSGQCSSVAVEFVK